MTMTVLGVVPSTTPPPPAPALLDILTSEDLAILRAGYDPSFLLGLAPRMVSYPKAAGFVGWISDVVFTYGAKASSLSPAAREMVIVAVMATERDTFVLSGHLYWALMEGLSVEQIGDTLATVATYRGINDLRYSLAVFQDVLLLLKKAVNDGGDAVTVQKVTAAMKATFEPY
jgi:alkylhydroperoxidase/carboxymuconolactone decarboxylase family protein YurZ